MADAADQGSSGPAKSDPIAEPIEHKGPVGVGFTRLSDIPEDTFVVVAIGFEGTGKTLFPVKGAPLPMMMGILDRPLTTAALGVVSKARADQVYYKNLRDSMDPVISELEATLIRDQLETMIVQNLDWLKGGTFVLDGGSLWRDVLKSADPTIAAKTAANKKFNPKDKAAINAYIANFLSYVQDKGINLVITGHTAYSWEMVAVYDENTGQSRKQLQRTKQVYPKLDDIILERSTHVLLMFKRCQCGLNITSQDGTCDAIKDSMDPKAEMGHQGRKHMTRFVTNKFCTATEGTVWENLTWAMMKQLSGDPKKAAQLIEANNG